MPQWYPRLQSLVRLVARRVGHQSAAAVVVEVVFAAAVPVAVVVAVVADPAGNKDSIVYLTDPNMADKLCVAVQHSDHTIGRPRSQHIPK